MDRPVDSRARVAAFGDRSEEWSEGRVWTERDLTLPARAPEGIGAIPRGSAAVTMRALAERGALLRRGPVDHREGELA